MFPAARPSKFRFDRAITVVDHLIRPSDDAPFLAPGWIDLQVNGFAGVDYNSPSSSHEQIAHSIRAMFAAASRVSSPP